MVRDKLDELKREYSGGRVSFYNLGVEEDYNGEGFYMSQRCR